MSEKIALSGVPETMLQTVYARARETQTRGAIRDEKAVELVRRLDYDFHHAEADTAMRSGVVARTIVLDRLTEAYLRAHPDAVVVNIACGLDARCYRMTGYTHWYNLDLPETIAVRRALLPDFRFVEEHCLTEGMAAFVLVYRLLDKLPAARNISNRIVVLERPA